MQKIRNTFTYLLYEQRLAKDVVRNLQQLVPFTSVAELFFYLFEKLRSPVPNEADLACQQEAGGDGRVDVTTADVCNHPDNRRHAEAERQRDLHQVGLLSRVEVGARAARNEDEQESAEKFGDQRHPELTRLDVLQASRRHRRLSADIGHCLDILVRLMTAKK